jgi:chromatin assembly factor 1 subunit B
VNQRPSSPTRSNSTSSIVTQASAVAAGVLTNPPLIAGQVPSIAAASSGKVTGVPIATPPETPRPSGPTQSGAGTKRETSESELDEASESQPKRRRIAPTLISAGMGSGTTTGPTNSEEPKD